MFIKLTRLDKITLPYLYYNSGEYSSHNKPKHVIELYNTFGWLDYKWGSINFINWSKSFKKCFFVFSDKIPINTKLTCYAFQSYELKPS